jgi:hypothetical protein
MRPTLRSGGKDYHLFGPWDIAPPGAEVPFADVLAVRAFLERLLFSADNELTLQRVLGERRGPFGPPAGEGRLVDELARLVWSGDLRFVTIAEVELGVGLARAAPAEVARRPEEPVKETSWVEFVVVDDATGDPVPNVKLGIALPKKKKADHTTPKSGSVDFDPCDAGSCSLELDYEGATVGSTLELVGVGEPSMTPIVGATFPNKDKKPWRIAQVTRHRVRTGESLQSIAEGAGMSWQDLAKFNFGTESPKEINKALKAQVGCTRKTKDKNYRFDDSDTPGIIYVPQKIEQRGFPTGVTHKLRVRPITKPARPYLFSY